MSRKTPETPRPVAPLRATTGVGHPRTMFKTAARFLLLRFLPRRLIPFITVVEAVLLLRSVRKRSKVRVNDPATSRTAPPVAPTATPKRA